MKLSDLKAIEKIGGDLLAIVTMQSVPEWRPEWESIGEDAHDEVRQLLLHHALHHEIDCLQLTGMEVEFMGEIYNQVMDYPRYQPTEAELIVIRAINYKLRCWLHEK